MYEKSFKTQISAANSNHHSIAITYSNIGNVYDHQDKYTDAISMYEKALKIKLSAFGDNHTPSTHITHLTGT